MTRAGWGLALVALLAAMPGLARAQTADPTLMVLDPVGAPDPATAQQLGASLGEVGRALGYHVVTPAPGSVIGSLDPAASTDLVSIVQRTGLHRAVAVWVVPSSAGFDVQVGLASGDGSARSIRGTAGATGVVDLATTLLASLLPAPFAATQGAWGAVLAPPPVSVAPTTVSVARTVVAVPTEPPAREHHSRPTGLMIGGIAMFAGGWIAGLLIGVFGGYHDRSCIDLWGGGCSLPPGTSWDPAWDNFRASSLVPLIGPWIQLAVKPPSDDGWPEWLVADGLLQAAGFAMMIAGIVIFDEAGEQGTSVTVVPSVAPGQAGLTAVGRF